MGQSSLQAYCPKMLKVAQKLPKGAKSCPMGNGQCPSGPVIDERTKSPTEKRKRNLNFFSPVSREERETRNFFHQFREEKEKPKRIFSTSRGEREIDFLFSNFKKRKRQ